MLAAALAQIPHVVAEHGRAYEDCDQEMLLVRATTNRLLTNPLRRRRRLNSRENRGLRWLRYPQPPAARCAAPEFSAGHRGLAGGSDFNTELVATLRICSSPGEIRPTAGYSMRLSASILQLLTAQTNCQFSNIVRRQPLKCHW